jgi:hypothetical protein
LSCNCEDILNEKLCDVPFEWRSQIIKAVCKVQDYDYDCGKSCQTITFLTHFRNEMNQVCISYIDENKVKVDRCFDYDLTSTILNDLILPDCVPLPQGRRFQDLNFDEKFQHIINILCESCCGIPITTTTTTTCGDITSIIGGTGFTTTSTSTSSTTSTTTSNIPLPSTACSSGMDVVFVIDYNWAISPNLESLKLEINNIISAIETLSQNNYRLGLTIVDENRTNELQFIPYDGPNFVAPLFASTPSSQKYISTGTTQNESITQKITTLEKMSNNNKNSFLSKFNQLDTYGFPAGAGAFVPQPTDIALELIGTQNILGHNYVAGQFRNGVSKTIILLTNTFPGGRNQNLQEATTRITNIISPSFINQQIKFVLLTSDESFTTPQTQNPFYSLATQTQGGIFFSKVNGSYLPNNFNNSGKDAFNSITSVCGNPSISIPVTSVTTSTTNTPPKCCEWENKTGSTVSGLTFTLCNPCCSKLVNFSLPAGSWIPVVEGTEQGPGFSQLTKISGSCFPL